MPSFRLRKEYVGGEWTRCVIGLPRSRMSWIKWNTWLGNIESTKFVLPRTPASHKEEGLWVVGNHPVLLLKTDGSYHQRAVELSKIN